MQAGGRENSQLQLPQKGVILDGLVGTGFKGEVQEILANAIRAANQSGLPIFAIDIPSGLDGTTGKIYGTCIRASTTVTFNCMKKGFLIHQGPRYAGKVVVTDIGIPLTLFKELKLN